jgi:FRG domain
LDELDTIESLDDALRLTAPNCAALDSLRGEQFGSHPRDALELWFRGQSSAEWSLKPSLDRQIERRALPPEIEYTIYVDFRRSEALTRGFKVSCMLDVLCLMQHYGIPTRTLDWSTNVAVGLYFVVQDCPEAQRDGALYVLNPSRLNRESTGISVIHVPESGPVEARGWMVSEPTLPSLMNYLSDNRPSYKAEIEEAFNGNSPAREAYMQQCRLPVAVVPDMITGRMKAQDAMLVIHGGTRRSVGDGGFGRPILLDEVNNGIKRHPCLAKFLVPSAAKERIRGELMRIGIHRARLFPELENQAFHLWEQAVDRHKVLQNRERNKPGIPGVTEFSGF